jgi:hypothetical protein
MGFKIPWHRYKRFPILGFYLRFRFYRILVYSRFGLDRCHCNIKLQNEQFVFVSLIKTWISNLVCTTCFWNNLHQVRSLSKDWKAK